MTEGSPPGGDVEPDGHVRLSRLTSLLSSPTRAGAAPVGIGPNWFASVMGTGILATAAATLPILAPYLHEFAVAMWLIAAAMLVGLSAALCIQTARHPHVGRGHARDPVMAQFYGAPPMAMMTVGAGTLLVGKSLLGLELALGVSWVLWFVGTIGGLATAVLVPYRLFTQYDVKQDAAFGGWLMPVVPPMVSATAGGLLVPYAPEGVWRETLFLGCFAMFGLSLIAALIIITMIWSRLAHFGSSGTARVPTLWIVLGPLGQSMTAAGVLGRVAPTAVDPELAAAMQTFAVLYGVPVWGFAALWSCLAGLLTLRTIRRKMPFALTWWAFTFPVGTCVTGTTGLALSTDLPAFQWGAVIGYAGLIGAWLLVAIRTTRGSIKGHALSPAVGAPAPAARKDNANDRAL